ncbi:putative autotransporter adhesin-like protein [Maribacter caenipelagi]|uniref:Putative autotransporter adhesin-like protein n=1 Tax=Maribacter caenipelagi TaxID=1447781 RepID=A0A4R7CW02_9FLAO|nr:head GIN domain-containing protein [Maribacter caenipelagi]TDS12673.1 putative autotransporter adhesin-like protein [Maribacter caenipelagi]
MKKLIFALLAVTFVVGSIEAQDKTFNVKSFDKLIVSPHIEVNLVQGEEESVVIDNAKVSLEKINVEVEGRTLRLYLDGAKVVTKSERISTDNWRGSKSLYNGTMASITVTYRKLENLSIRGEEIIRCKNLFNADDFKMSLYGEAKVYFDSVSIDELTVAIYGSSYLEIGEGNVARQVFRAYGESEVNTEGMVADETKITAYGESNFRVNVVDRLKVTCYGETNINYTGNPEVDKGLIFGEATIRKIG